MSHGGVPECETDSAYVAHASNMYLAFTRGESGGEVHAQKWLLQRFVIAKASTEVS